MPQILKYRKEKKRSVGVNWCSANYSTEVVKMSNIRTQLVPGNESTVSN
jgi:hypothetical protein